MHLLHHPLRFSHHVWQRHASPPRCPLGKAGVEPISNSTATHWLQDVEKKLDFTRDPPERHIVITSYDLAQKLRTYERHFGVIICDESHALKNRESQRTQFFQHLFSRNIAKRVLFLTGTPALSRPIELFTQVRLALETLRQASNLGIG